MDSNNPYTGKRVTLISNAGIRYEGTLVDVNPNDATVGLSKVRIFGSEDRSVANFVPPSENVYESVLFRGTDIREIALIAEDPAPFVDSAIVRMEQQPSTKQPQHTAAPPTQSLKASLSKPFSASKQDDSSEHREPFSSARDSESKWQTNGAKRLPFSSANDSSLPAHSGHRRASPTSFDQDDQYGEERSWRQQGGQHGVRSSFFDRESGQASRGNAGSAYGSRGGAWTRGGSANQYQRGSSGFGFGSHGAPQSQRGGHGYGYGSGYGNNYNYGGGSGSRDYSGSNNSTSGWNRGGPRAWHASGPPARGGGNWRRGGGAGNSAAGGPPAEYQVDFDFESGNSQLAHELEKLHIDGHHAKGDAGKPDEQAEAGPEEDVAANEDADGDADSTNEEGRYDKQKSFFDSISSEITTGNKKPNWHRERQVNAETFGQSALRRGGRGGNSRANWRGWRRGAYAY